MTDMKNDIAEMKRCMNQKVSAVGDAILEGKEKERRETNIILHQVPELLAMKQMPRSMMYRK